MSTALHGIPAATRRLARLCLSASTLLLLAGQAGAQLEIGASGGGFLPWEGSGGPSAQLRIGGGPSESRWRFAAEADYHSFESEVFGLDDVDVESVGLRALVTWIFRPDALLSPYLGAGLGLGVKIIDDEAIEQHLLATRPGLLSAQVDPVGLSSELFGLVGLQLSLGDHLRLFGEGRFGGDWLLTSQQETNTFSGDRSETDFNLENLGGVSAIIGIRFVFGGPRSPRGDRTELARTRSLTQD